MWFKRRKKTEQDHALSESLRSLQSLLNETGRREPSLDPQAGPGDDARPAAGTPPRPGNGEQLHAADDAKSLSGRPSGGQSGGERSGHSRAASHTPTRGQSRAERRSEPEGPSDSGSRWRDLNLSFDAEPILPRVRRETTDEPEEIEPEPGQAREPEDGTPAVEPELEAPPAAVDLDAPDAVITDGEAEDTDLYTNPTPAAIPDEPGQAPAAVPADEPTAPGAPELAEIPDSVEREVRDEPAADEPAVDEPVVDEPVVDEPVVDEPVVDEPVVDEPVVDEPVVDEPAADEPAADEPAAEEPAADEPAAAGGSEPHPVTDIRDHWQSTSGPDESASGAQSADYATPPHPDEEVLVIDLEETSVPAGDEHDPGEAPAATGKDAADTDTTGAESESAEDQLHLELEPAASADQADITEADIPVLTNAVYVPEPAPAASAPAPGPAESPHEARIGRYIEDLRVRLQLMGLDTLSEQQEREVHDSLVELLDELDND